MPNNSQIINLALGELYQDRIPQATKDNLADVAEAIMNYEPAKNAVLTEVYNKIALTIIRSMRFSNPLEIFRKEDIRYGDTVEDIFVEIPKGYDPRSVSNDPFTKMQPSVKALYKSINSEIQYEQTITDVDFRKAMRSEGGLTSLVNTIVGNMAVAGGTDDFLKLKQVMADTEVYGKVRYLGAPSGDATKDALTLLKAIKNTGSAMGFPSKAFNAMGVVNTAMLDDQVLIITAEQYNSINIDLLTGYFNLSKGEIEQRIVVVDNFNDTNISAVICHRDFLDYRKSLQDGGMIYNPKGVPYTNHFYNVYGLYSVSLFMPAVAFIFSEEPTVDTTIVAKSNTGTTLSDFTVTGNDGKTYTSPYKLPEGTYTVAKTGYKSATFVVTRKQIKAQAAITVNVTLDAE